MDRSPPCKRQEDGALRYIINITSISVPPLRDFLFSAVMKNRTDLYARQKDNTALGGIKERVISRASRPATRLVPLVRLFTSRDGGEEVIPRAADKFFPSFVLAERRRRS